MVSIKEVVDLLTCETRYVLSATYPQLERPEPLLKLCLSKVAQYLVDCRTLGELKSRITLPIINKIIDEEFRYKGYDISLGNTSKLLFYTLLESLKSKKTNKEAKVSVKTNIAINIPPIVDTIDLLIEVQDQIPEVYCAPMGWAGWICGEPAQISIIMMELAKTYKTFNIYRLSERKTDIYPNTLNDKQVKYIQERLKELESQLDLKNKKIHPIYEKPRCSSCPNPVKSLCRSILYANIGNSFTGTPKNKQRPKN